MATVKKIKASDKVRVFKNLIGSCSFSAKGFPSYWEENLEYKDIMLSDLEDALGSQVINSIFEKNKFLIKDEEAREFLRLSPLGDDYLDSDKIKELLNSKDSNKVEEIVESCEDSELDMIVETAVKEKIKDKNILGILEDYTGLPLIEDIENNIDIVEKSDISDKTIKRTKKK